MSVHSRRKPSGPSTVVNSLLISENFEANERAQGSRSVQQSVHETRDMVANLLEANCHNSQLLERVDVNMDEIRFAMGENNKYLVRRLQDVENVIGEGATETQARIKREGKRSRTAARELLRVARNQAIRDREEIIRITEDEAKKGREHTTEEAIKTREAFARSNTRSIFIGCVVAIGLLLTGVSAFLAFTVCITGVVAVQMIPDYALDYIHHCCVATFCALQTPNADPTPSADVEVGENEEINNVPEVDSDDSDDDTTKTPK